jgi:hypothetical protein
MLSDPETRESTPFRVLGQVERVMKPFRDGVSDSNGSKIEDREAGQAEGCHHRLDVLTSDAGAAGIRRLGPKSTKSTIFTRIRAIPISGGFTDAKGTGRTAKLSSGPPLGRKRAGTLV